jgi:hypothetical protein
MWTQLATLLGAINDSDFGPLVACSLATETGSIDFGFGGSGGAIISVPFSELAIPFYDPQGNPQEFDDGTTACYFGVSPASDGEPLLFGDTFLRSAYVVYDLDDKEIGIAPTVFHSEKSNIVEIGKAVASGWKVDSSVTAKQTATGAGPAPGAGQPTATKIATTVHAGTRGVKTQGGAAATATTKSSMAITLRANLAFSFIGGFSSWMHIIVVVLLLY